MRDAEHPSESTRTVGRATIRNKLSAGALPAAVVGAVAIGVAMSAAAKPEASMRGSPASMQSQHAVAVSNDYTFAETPAAVADLVSKDRLVRLPGNPDYRLNRVSYPFGRPAVKAFVENLARDYRKACGEQLVVTSLTRPRSEQPGNAHQLSVHPAGMAVDFRVSKSAKCREFMEKALLGLERKELLDATRERNPPHFHVAVYPREYRKYAATLPPVERAAPPAAAARTERAPVPPAVAVPARAAERAASADPAEAPQTGAAILAAIILLGLAGFAWWFTRRTQRRL